MHILSSNFGLPGSTDSFNEPLPEQLPLQRLMPMVKLTAEAIQAETDVLCIEFYNWTAPGSGITPRLKLPAQCETVIPFPAQKLDIS